MELEKRAVDFDIVASTRVEAVDFPENGQSVTRHVDDARFVHHVLVEWVYRIFPCELRGRNVEPANHITRLSELGVTIIEHFVLQKYYRVPSHLRRLLLRTDTHR